MILEGAAAARTRLPFRSVNRGDRPGHQPGMQRHHLLPRQLLGARCYGGLFAAIGHHSLGFDDFRLNGLLLPACDTAAERIGLPLHCGPHRAYNELVGERVGRIEADWSAQRLRAPEVALEQARMRLALLQRALRRRLLSPARRMRLNSRDRLGAGIDFSELDAMAETLWGGTQEAVMPVFAAN
ncbi:MAG: AHH domain-containing protein [Candidatus Andeanibacterium colombiense]|uniref:AHH domain-containing protein n=1 Tax=Candidatus Andeanibacterium colombiense TaxID=3121345 RepID=A0AAJ5X700_9SPHN|nr:MAG: AHH domain-containing protein [Sphingomonadaceae bacterium]